MADENKAAGEDPIRPGDAGWHLTSPKERLAVEFTGRLPQPVSPDWEAMREQYADTLALLFAKNRTGGAVFMGGEHNPRPSEIKAARQFVDDMADALLSGPLAGVLEAADAAAQDVARRWKRDHDRLLAENERLRKPDLRMMYGYELGIEDGKAERDALAAKVRDLTAQVAAVEALLANPAHCCCEADDLIVWADELSDALDTPEGEKQ